MNWSVQQLGHGGLLDPKRIPELGIVGKLSIEYVADAGAGYPRKVARLIAGHGEHAGQLLLCPLLDPVIMKLDQGGLLLHGRQQRAGAQQEQPQVWRCLPLPADGSAGLSEDTSTPTINCL